MKLTISLHFTSIYFILFYFTSCHSILVRMIRNLGKRFDMEIEIKKCQVILIAIAEISSDHFVLFIQLETTFSDQRKFQN